ESYSFLWLYDSSTERILPYSERTLVSLDGTLYFSYVTKNDETSYACSLSLPYTQSGHYGPFFRLHVPVSQTTLFAPRLDTTQPQIFPESLSVGSTVYLECFAYGNPVPIYKWSRVDGKTLNEKSLLMHHGRVLRIDSVELSDMGRYRCSAANSLGVAAKEVTLTLRSPPTIVIPLSDRHVATVSDLILECPLSSTDLHSSVEWFKDAKPIVPILMPSERRKRFHVDHNRLVVNSTSTSDSGVYQCIVSNEVGVASSSAYVLVRDSAPIFPRQSMPRKIFAVNGSLLSIPCFYHASPRGHSRWADAGGAKLPHKGRVRDRHGVLIIENVLHDDAGYFFCTAHNRLGKAHSQVELIVLGKACQTVSNYYTINISCSVEIDCGRVTDCPEALFQWTFDNRSVNFMPGLHFKTKVEISARGRQLLQKVDIQVISTRTQAGQPQRVACYSLYGEDSIDLPYRPFLPAPLALKVEQDEQTVRLMWRRSINTHRDTRNHTDVVGGYLVELRTKEDRQWRAVPRRIVAESESHSITLNDLIPNTLYQFRVRTVDAFTMGEPSSPSPWVKTPPAAPSETIDGLRWRSLDNSTIFVEWNPVETVHHSGDHLRYRLSWSVDDAYLTVIDNVFITETKSPQAILKLNNSKECRMLVFSVRPMNDQGAGLISTDTVAYVHRNGEPRYVSFTNVSVLNSTHVSFSWEWQNENECGKARAVQVGNTLPLELSLSKTSKKFHSCKLLDISYVNLILQGNYGATSKVLEIMTKQKPPSEAPIINKLSLKTMNDHVGYTTIIEWSAIEFPYTNLTDDTTGYKIFVYVSETASEAVKLTMPVSQLTNPDRPSARLDGLRLMYMYTIQVAGYNSGGLGPLSASRTIRLGTQSSLENSSKIPFDLCLRWISLLSLVAFLSL
uniref:Protogenin n=1 Tax=Angiostrongylus cantonensis TaxID=6313 RepID=A0A158P6X8_ANGCA